MNHAPTLIDLLYQRAECTPHQQLYTFLLDGETEESHLTYAELAQSAQTIAMHLQERNATGQRALLLYTPGLAFIKAFFGCLCAGVVAVPSYPPRRKGLSPRLQAIIQDAEPAILLCDEKIATVLDKNQHPALAHLPRLNTERMRPEQPTTWSRPVILPDDLAFLQYTSGSTASPKGVMISHANLVHNLDYVQRGFEVTPESVGVIWLPPYHDLGLIGGILEPLYTGMQVVLFDPMAFLAKPLRWLQAISNYRGTESGGPNFAYELCISQITPEQCQTLDLSSWELAFNGAEPIRSDILTRFTEKFAPYGFRPEAFYPGYGLAESTLMVSGGQKSERPVFQQVDQNRLQKHLITEPQSPNDAHILVGCGTTWRDQQLVIVDPKSSIPCPSGQIGEVWVSGPCVAQGYWRRPQESVKTFQARLAKPFSTTEPTTFLRTGDLGFLKEDELFITGRLKELIIINGRNYYPQDIAYTVEQSHIALQTHGCAAFSLEHTHGANGRSPQPAGLVIVAELKRTHRRANAKEVIQSIRTAISQTYGLALYDVVLIKPGHLPKTTSGKIQHYLCREQFLNGTFPEIGRYRTEIQQVDTMAKGIELNGTVSNNTGPNHVEITKLLQTQIADLLGLPPHQIDLTQPLNGFGLGSINAMVLKQSVEKQFQVELPIDIFFEEISATQLIDQIKANTATHSANGAVGTALKTGVATNGNTKNNSTQIPQMNADFESWQFAEPVDDSDFFSAQFRNTVGFLDDSPHLSHPESQTKADELIQWLRQYASRRINPQLIDERRTIPPHIVLDWGNQGLLGMQIPKQYGGLALDYGDTLRIIEQIAAIDLNLALFVGNHHSLGTRPILRYAQPEVREMLLPRIAQGRELAAFALTEPGAGANPRALSTVATPISGHHGSDATPLGWSIQGQKSWIGSGAWAGITSLFTRTLDSQGNFVGISGFLVRQDTPGLRQGPEALTMGMRGSIQNTLYLDDLRVGPMNLLGSIGEGMTVAQDAMMVARLGIAAMSIGGMKRCLQLMYRYGTRRTVATGRLLDNPVTLTRLNDLTAVTTCLEQLTRHMTTALDQGEALPDELYIACKIAGPEWLGVAADHLVQLLGGRGYIESNIAPKILRDARVLRIFEGPTEALSLYLGERIFHQGDAFYAFLANWGTPKITHALQEVTRQIAQMIEGAGNDVTNRLGGRLSTQRYAYAQIGELATLAILQAAVQSGLHGLSTDDSSLRQHAAEWSANQFEQKTQLTLSSLSTTTSFFLAEEIGHVVHRYTQSIGQFEQQAANPDRELDALLRFEAPIQNTTSPEPQKPLVNRYRNGQPPTLSAGLQTVEQPLETNGHPPAMQTIQPQPTMQTSTDTNLPVEGAPVQPEILAETYQIERFPEVNYLQQQLASLSIPNPYFKAHHGTNGNETQVEGQTLLNYAGYNYVGLSGHPAIQQAAQEAMAQYGTSVSASRLASGEIPPHRSLEEGLAKFIGVEDCLVYVGGFTTNVTTIGHLLGPRDLICYDALIHSSALQGAALSGADKMSFPHNDWQALDALLATKRQDYRRVLIVIEGVYSMDGDIPDLPRFMTLKKRHKALLMVDEAHSIGVLGAQGRGIAEHFGIDPTHVDIWMGTLSKSFASCGGYIAGSKALVDYLKYTAPGFIYSVGMSPQNTAAALAALHLLQAEPERVDCLRQRSQLFLTLAQTRGLNTGDSHDSAVIPIIVGDSQRCMQLSHALFEQGISVLPIIFPAVAEDMARLRFFISSMHTEEQIRWTVDVIADILNKID